MLGNIGDKIKGINPYCEICYTKKCRIHDRAGNSYFYPMNCSCGEIEQARINSEEKDQRLQVLKEDLFSQFYGYNVAANIEISGAAEDESSAMWDVRIQDISGCTEEYDLSIEEVSKLLSQKLTELRSLRKKLNQVEGILKE